MEDFKRQARQGRQESCEPNKELDKLANIIVDSAMFVHKSLGPGLLESAYEQCLYFDLLDRGLAVERQKPINILFKNRKIESAYKMDMVVNEQILIELKSTEKIISLYEAQMLTYLKLSKYPLGFLFNFNTRLLKDGMKRYVSLNAWRP